MRRQHPARLTLALLAVGALLLSAPARAATPSGSGRSTASSEVAPTCPDAESPIRDTPKPPFGLSPTTDESYTDPAAIADSEDRLEAFALDDDGTIQRSGQTSVNGPWSAWSELGSPPGLTVLSGPAVAQNHTGAIDVFAIGSDCQLWHTWQTLDENNSWHAWAAIGKPSGVPLLHLTAVQDTNAKASVFCVDSNGATYETQEEDSGGTMRWSEWRNLGGTANSLPVPFPYGDKNIDLVEVDAEGQLQHNTWAPDHGTFEWSGWQPLGGPVLIGDPAVAAGQDGREEVFATATNGDLVKWAQRTPGAALQETEIPAHLTGSPTAATNKDGRMEVFANGSDGTLQIAIETSPNSGTLTDWDSLNAGETNSLVAGTVAAVRNQAGALNLVGLNAAGYPVTDAQTAANDLKWTGWNTLPVGASSK